MRTRQLDTPNVVPDIESVHSLALALAPLLQSFDTCNGRAKSSGACPISWAEGTYVVSQIGISRTVARHGRDQFQCDLQNPDPILCAAFSATQLTDGDGVRYRASSIALDSWSQEGSVTPGL